MTNATQIEESFEALSQSDESFQVGQVAAFMYVNGTIALAVVMLLVLLLVVAPISMRRERLRGTRTSSRTEAHRSFVAHLTWRRALVTYLMVAPVLVLLWSTHPWRA